MGPTISSSFNFLPGRFLEHIRFATVLTASGAFWVARMVERGAPLHGFLVGLVVALILFIFNPALTNYLQGAYRGRLDLLVVALGTFFLTVAAGWLGGVLGRRGRQKS